MVEQQASNNKWVLKPGDTYKLLINGVEVELPVASPIAADKQFQLMVQLNEQRYVAPQ